MKLAPARPDVPEIVAHRGDAEHFPENSLPGLEAAWRSGLRWAEFDVQLSADHVPYVIHDAALERTTRGSGDLRLMNSGQLDGIDAGEPARFGAAHAGTRLPRLEAVAARLAALPQARAFVELKRASLAHHGRALCVDVVLATLAAVLDRCVLISFDAEACRLARRAGSPAIGWVLDAPPVAARPTIESLAPDCLFCDHRLLAAGEALPPEAGPWVVYETTSAGQARDLFSRGAAFVESMTPARIVAGLAGSAP